MTREDAIYWIKNLAVLSSEKDITNITEALDMAIEALQQQRKAILPKHCIVPSGDYIATAGVPKRGKWVKKEHLVPLARDAEPLDWDKYDEKTHSELEEYWHCSECDYEGDRHFRPLWKYCPNCGARMESDRK